MNRNTLAHIFFGTALMAALTATAQDDKRLSSSLYLQPLPKADVTIPFAVDGEGQRFQPIWGLDLQWVSEQNLRKGVRHMGIDNVSIGRSGFRATKPLINDSTLAEDQINYLRRRSNLFSNVVSPTLPLVLTADQEPGADQYFVKNKSCNVEHWAAMINSHVHWMQENTQHPIVGVSPFNEPDYWSVEEGATVAKQVQVAKLLKQNYPRFADIALVGGNTLNNDKALAWYQTGTDVYDWGNTHQLAGSFDTFASFFTRLQNDRKVGYADEMHNVAEAMIGLEYGMTVGIWWGFDSRARGEFCDISRHGERLAYAEHRNNWTAGSVYRHDDGRVKAFVGSSERQAKTTTYQFISTNRDIFYNSYGPMRSTLIEIPGGSGYQNGQTNAECVVDITWGEDVPPVPITEGTYRIVSKASGNSINVSGSTILMQKGYAKSKTQHWIIKPVDTRIGGDFSFYEIESASKANLHINIENFSTLDGAKVIGYSSNATPDSNEQWYLEYAGDGYYYIRSRETSLYLSAQTTGTNNGVAVQTNELQADETERSRQLWRLLPAETLYEAEAPARPEGLVAEPQTSSVRLSWTANTEKDLLGYTILRADQATGEWNTIARCIDGCQFVDNSCNPSHTYIYKVKAVDQAHNSSEPSNTVESKPTGEHGLTAQWRFNESLFDATPNMMDVAHSGDETYVNGHTEDAKAISLNKDRFVQLPYEVASSDELTVCMWVNWISTGTWQRIFDFGNGTSQYMFLTPNNGKNMRFAIKNGGDEQIVDCPAKLTAAQWRHVAVTIGTGKATIYIDGEEVASNTGITIRPSDLNASLNYLGRSQFNADPAFAGYLEDVRIYNYALTAEEVRAAMTNEADGITPATTDSDNNNGSPVYSIDGRKLTQPARGINIIDGKKIINTK